jgi:antitoxin component YwqK of YwqJK toxin-antitoxin module
MKNRLRNIAVFLPVCLLLTANLFSQTNTADNPNGHNTYYYPNGRISSEGMMRDGKPDGYWRSYYPTGVMKSEGNRLHSLLDSTWVFYTQTGDTAEIINYRLGKKSGFSYQYATITERNNVSRHYLKSKELYLDDRREGASHYYYPSGKIRQIIYYRNDRKQGHSKEYDENGTVITLYEYRNDHMISRDFVNRLNAQGEKTGTWVAFYPDGKPMEEEFYVNGVLEGVAKTLSEMGTTISQRVYRAGNLIEESVQMDAEPMELTSFWEDGVTIKRKGVYLDSIPIRFHQFYNREGKPERSIRYSERGTGIRTGEGPIDENERRTGEWKLFFETGELRASGKYVNDRQTGEWIFYDLDGKKMQVGNFNNGVMEGEWKWFYPSGSIFREEVYVRGNRHGLCIQYSDSATIVAKGEYVDNEREGPWIEHIGDSREEGSYIMGEKNGIWRTYHRDGHLLHTGEFVHGSPNGRHLFYHPDGKTIKEEQHYVMGRRDKNWKKHYENGTLFLTITYKNDEEVRINGIRIDEARR